VNDSSFNEKLSSDFNTVELPADVYRYVILTGILAVSTLWTTGFTGMIPKIVLAVGIVLIYFGRPPFSLGRAGQIASLFFLGITYYQWKKDIPGIVALSDFTCWIMILQWWMITDIASAQASNLLSAMLVFAAAAMNVNFLFPLAFFPYVIFLFISLSKLGFNQHIADIGKNTRYSPKIRFIAAAMSSRSWLSVVSQGFVFLVLWIGFFYLIPRPDIMGLAPGVGQRKLMGFSESLNLGEIGTIRDNPMVIMRIRPILNPPISPSIRRKLQSVLLRGCSFHSYKRGAWSRSGYRGYYINMSKNGGEFRLSDENTNSNQLVALEILLENTDPPVLFIPDKTKTILLDIPSIQIQTDGAFFLVNRRIGFETYQVKVALDDKAITDPGPLKDVKFPSFVEHFLDPGDSGYAVKTLAEDVASSTPTLLGKVLAVHAFLNGNYRYSLEEFSTSVRDPVANFLFQSQQGSCEHFASAMTLMLRHLGIPARPVNGYIMEEWNNFGNYFTIRQSDAHSWVEVFFPDQGWVSFDPTPPSTSGTLLQRFAILRDLRSRFEGWWFTYVYRFDKKIQASGFRKLFMQAGGLHKQLALVAGILRGNLILKILLLIALIILYVFSARIRLSKTKNRHWIPNWYNEWTMRFDHMREKWETPKEYHSRLIRLGLFPREMRPELEKLEHAIENYAFGVDHTLAEKEGRQVIGNIVEALKSK